jgi:amino acid permease
MEENTTVPALPSPSKDTGGDKKDAQKKRTIAILIGVAVVIVALIIVAAVLLIQSSNETTGRIRDVFIIFMALESLVIGVALIVLIVQLATLINLLQNEVKPIIESTNETVNTLRGTAAFLSDNLSEPVIQLNSYLAGLKTFFDLMKPGRKR